MKMTANTFANKIELEEGSSWCALLHSISSTEKPVSLHASFETYTSFFISIILSLKGGSFFPVT